MITKTSAAKNAACDAVTDLIDSGSTLSAGRLTIYATDGSSVATMALSNPAFMGASDGTAQAYTIYDATATRDASASTFWISDRDGTNVYGGTISDENGSGDLKFNIPYFTADSTVSIASAYFIVP